MDIDEAKYHKGELLTGIQTFEFLISDFEYELSLPETTPAEKAGLRAGIERCKQEIEDLKVLVKKTDRIIANRTTREKAINFLKKAIESDQLIGWVGYKDLYKTESKFELEMLFKVINTLQLRWYWVSNNPHIDYKAIMITLPVDLIEELYPDVEEFDYEEEDEKM